MICRTCGICYNPYIFRFFSDRHAENTFPAENKEALMKANALRWIVVVLMLTAMIFLVSSPGLAETEFTHVLEGPDNPTVPLRPLTLDAPGSYEPLAMDQLVKGRPLKLANLSGDNMEYQDGSIHAIVTHDTVEFKDYAGKLKLNCYIIRVTIADASQMRSCMSYDDYDTRKQVKAATMAQSANAVAAVNGDFFKNAADRGYIFRQGVFYRDKAEARRDVLLIDSEGDFHIIHAATGADVEEAMAALPEGVTGVNTFNIGPALIENGQVVNMMESTVATTRNSHDQFQYRYRMQRAAIVQLGHLQYAIVECNGTSDAKKGMNIQVLADYIKDLFPDAITAYNLDGGGSTNVIFPQAGVNKKTKEPEVQFIRIHKNPDAREICDLLYFASLED